MDNKSDNLLADLEVDAPSVIGGNRAAPPTPGELGDRVRDETHGVVSPETRPAPTRPEVETAELPDLTP